MLIHEQDRCVCERGDPCFCKLLNLLQIACRSMTMSLEHRCRAGIFNTQNIRPGTTGGTRLLTLISTAIENLGNKYWLPNTLYSTFAHAPPRLNQDIINVKNKRIIELLTVPGQKQMPVMIPRGIRAYIFGAHRTSRTHTHLPPLYLQLEKYVQSKKCQNQKCHPVPFPCDENVDKLRKLEDMHQFMFVETLSYKTGIVCNLKVQNVSIK